MDTRIESDIAYIKTAVSNFTRPDVELAALGRKIDRLNEELRESRSRILDLELFQTVTKGVLCSAGGMVVVALIVAIFKAAAVGPSEENIAPKTDASQQADATHSGPE